MLLRTICAAVGAMCVGLVSAPATLAKNSAGGAVYDAAAVLPATPTLDPVVPPVSATIVSGLTGGQAYGVLAPSIPQITVAGNVAKILSTGYAAAPAGAPPAVKAAIFAANQIVGLPYVYGGGHQSFVDTGYDCSGTVSVALHAANVLTTPMSSSDLMAWGVRGVGQWITVYTKPSHAYMAIAGIRLDTSTAGDPSGLEGPRWRPLARPSRGFHARSMPGL